MNRGARTTFITARVYFFRTDCSRLNSTDLQQLLRCASTRTRALSRRCTQLTQGAPKPRLACLRRRDARRQRESAGNRTCSIFCALRVRFSCVSAYFWHGSRYFSMKLLYVMRWKLLVSFCKFWLWCFWHVSG